jgi:hypothetical protein
MIRRIKLRKETGEDIHGCCSDSDEIHIVFSRASVMLSASSYISDRKHPRLYLPIDCSINPLSGQHPVEQCSLIDNMM